VRKISRALEKVYADKAVHIEQQVQAGLNFLGDERDLMELLGNVLDNACKYGRGQVAVKSRVLSINPPRLELLIEDNGPGIAAEDSDRILQRGVRLDSLAQGQGIGLAVVSDIVQSYGGKITVNAAQAGGAAISILLPNFRIQELRAASVS